MHPTTPPGEKPAAVEKPAVLSVEQREATKKASIAEGGASSVMLGFGEQYVAPFAIRLGASNTQIGFLSSFPFFIGSLFQLLGAKLTDKYQDRRKLVMFGVLFQALSFAPLFLVPLFTKSVLLLTFFFCLYLAFGNLAGPSWTSMMADVIPLNERAHYFGRRNKYVFIALFASVLLSGIILNHFEAINIWLGFGILFGLALAGRLTSFFLFFKHHDPVYKADIWDDFRFQDFLKELPSNHFGNFVIFRTVFSFSVMLAAPFFAVFMLSHLHFNYLQFSAVILMPMLIKALTMTYWGEISGRFGNKSTLYMTAVLIALIPALWGVVGLLVHTRVTAFILILLIEIITGFAWAGFELTTFNYLLEHSSNRRRVKLFAYFNVAFGFMIFIGGLAGSGALAFLKDSAPGATAIIAVLFFSAFARFLTVVLLMPRVQEVSTHEKIGQKRLFYEVILSRPMGYAAHSLNRLIIVEDEVVMTIRNMVRGSEKAKRKKPLVPIEPTPSVPVKTDLVKGTSLSGKKQ
jgi:MFS family permease